MAELVVRLAEKTKSGSVRWRRGPDSYQGDLSGPFGAVYLTLYTFQDRRPQLSVRQEKGLQLLFQGYILRHLQRVIEDTLSAPLSLQEKRQRIEKERQEKKRMEADAGKLLRIIDEKSE